jgi:hypothetical protein
VRHGALDRFNSICALLASWTVHIGPYDPWSGFLLTGDTVLPGRLYAFDYPAFVQTMHRLVAFTQRRTVTHVLGGHIEMTSRTGRDFPFGAQFHPSERRLQMTRCPVSRCARGRSGCGRS